MDELHERYAKNRRIDEAAAIRAGFQVRVEAPVDRVWMLLSDPVGWSAIDPAIRDVEVDGAVEVGTRFVWRNGSLKLRSRFAVVDPCTELTWTGTTFGARAVHRHLLEQDGPSGTLLGSEESMAGALLGLFYDSSKLHSALAEWVTAVKAAAERP